MDIIYLLRALATEMGGKVIASGKRSVGFSMENKRLLKLVAEGDSVILEQVSGPERGKRAEIGTLSEIRRGQ